jgi:hypothetical protein
METTKVANVTDSLWKSRMTSGTPGANIDEPSGVMRVRKDRIARSPYFLGDGQFMGF